MIPSPTKPILMTPPTRLRETRSAQTATISGGASSRAADTSPAQPPRLYRSAVRASRSRLPRRLSKFQKSRCTSHSSRCGRVIQDAQLGEYRGLIPIEMLVGDFACLKLNDPDQGKLDPMTRRRHTGNHPIHIECMGKSSHELFDDPSLAEGLRQQGEIEIWRNVRQELTSIELAHSYPTHSARPGRNGEDIRIFGH